MAYDATNRVEAPNYGTQIPQMGAAYPSNYPQPSGSAYPAQGSYPDMGTRTSGTYGGGGYPMNTQQPYQQPYAAQQTNRMRITALVLVLLGILLLLIAVILFVIQRTNTNAGTTPPAHTTTAIIYTISTPTLSDIPLGLPSTQQYYGTIHFDDVT
jgi:heme/copper-type cytochrome/quinol oxidase subunit 2